VSAVHQPCRRRDHAFGELVSHRSEPSGGHDSSRIRLNLSSGSVQPGYLHLQPRARHAATVRAQLVLGDVALPAVAQDLRPDVQAVVRETACRQDVVLPPAIASSRSTRRIAERTIGHVLSSSIEHVECDIDRWHCQLVRRAAQPVEANVWKGTATIARTTRNRVEYSTPVRLTRSAIRRPADVDTVGCQRGVG
jgi:hypothetical protein